MSKVVGDKMVQEGVKIYCGYGGTEFGNPMKFWDETPGSLAPLEVDHDWDYKVVSKLATVRWEPQGDGQYELVILVKAINDEPFELSTELRLYRNETVFSSPCTTCQGRRRMPPPTSLNLTRPGKGFGACKC